MTFASSLTFSSDFFTAKALLGASAIVLSSIAFKRLLSRSALRDIPGPPSQSWFTGNLGQLFTPKGLPFHQEINDQYGTVAKVHGFFGDEQLYISDPRALQSILVKDQDAFEETSVFIETNKVIFGPGLVATTGDFHKRQRRLVTPIFSLSQLRELTSTFYDVAERLRDVISNETKESKGSSVLDMSEWMCRVALESVGQAILGYSFDPLNSAHNNPYTSAIKELIPTIFSLSLVRQFAPFLSSLGPAWFRRRLVDITPVASVQKVKNMSDVMYETAQGILEKKRGEQAQEALGDEQNTKDLISVLLRANNSATHGNQLSESELIGQMTVLIFGAQDTTSSTLSRVMHLLGTHPEIQRNIREELNKAIENSLSLSGVDGRLSYDEIMGLPWMDAVFKETLRLYPPVSFVRRTTVKERPIPLSIPIIPNTPGAAPIDVITIPKGTTIFAAIAGANRSELAFGPDAKEWKPERWMGDGPLKGREGLHKLPGIYGGSLSFLAGERSCIGYKFAQIEMKVILATLLSNFSFSATQDEIVWNLSQIISPSVREYDPATESYKERKGLPLAVAPLSSAGVQ